MKIIDVKKLSGDLLAVKEITEKTLEGFDIMDTQKALEIFSEFVNYEREKESQKQYGNTIKSFIENRAVNMKNVVLKRRLL